jgi:hypothetical protein
MTDEQFQTLAKNDPNILVNELKSNNIKNVRIILEKSKSFANNDDVKKIINNAVEKKGDYEPEFFWAIWHNKLEIVEAFLAYKVPLEEKKFGNRDLNHYLHTAVNAIHQRSDNMQTRFTILEKLLQAYPDFVNQKQYIDVIPLEKSKRQKINEIFEKATAEMLQKAKTLDNYVHLKNWPEVRKSLTENINPLLHPAGQPYKSTIDHAIGYNAPLDILDKMLTPGVIDEITKNPEKNPLNYSLNMKWPEYPNNTISDRSKIPEENKRAVTVVELLIQKGCPIPEEGKTLIKDAQFSKGLNGEIVRVINNTTLRSDAKNKLLKILEEKYSIKNGNLESNDRSIHPLTISQNQLKEISNNLNNLIAQGANPLQPLTNPNNLSSTFTCPLAFALKENDIQLAIAMLKNCDRHEALDTLKWNAMSKSLANIEFLKAFMLEKNENLDFKDLTLILRIIPAIGKNDELNSIEDKIVEILEKHNLDDEDASSIIAEALSKEYFKILEAVIAKLDDNQLMEYDIETLENIEKDLQKFNKEENKNKIIGTMQVKKEKFNKSINELQPPQEINPFFGDENNESIDKNKVSEKINSWINGNETDDQLIQNLDSIKDYLITKTGKEVIQVKADNHLANDLENLSRFGEGLVSGIMNCYSNENFTEANEAQLKEKIDKIQKFIQEITSSKNACLNYQNEEKGIENAPYTRILTAIFSSAFNDDAEQNYNNALSPMLQNLAIDCSKKVTDPIYAINLFDKPPFVLQNDTFKDQKICVIQMLTYLCDQCNGSPIETKNVIVNAINNSMPPNQPLGYMTGAQIWLDLAHGASRANTTATDANNDAGKKTLQTLLIEKYENQEESQEESQLKNNMLQFLAWMEDAPKGSKRRIYA